MYARQILYIQSLIEIVYTLSKRRKKNDFKWQVIWVFKIKKNVNEDTIYMYHISFEICLFYANCPF